MIKKLFTQMRNEWRSNVWLAIELLIISLLLWFVFMSLCTKLDIYLRPLGFDANHCYKLSMGMVNSKSTEAKDYNNRSEVNDDVEELVERLRHYEGIEAVSLSCSSHPYNGSNNWNPCRIDTMTVDCVYRQITPDFIKVFRYEGANGETPGQLAEKVNAGGIFVSESFLDLYGKDIKEYVGKEMVSVFDSTWSPKIEGVFKTVRYSDFDNGFSSRSFLVKPKWRFGNDAELCIRVKPEADNGFMERFIKDKETRFRVGGLYISDIKSFEDIRANFHQSDYNSLRNAVTIAVFLLLNIFLGLFGTFWFRTQQRRTEIALHKALGATNSDVFIRLVSEGLFVLLITVPFTVAIASLIYYYGLFFSEDSWYTGVEKIILISGITSFAVIALVIVIGIYFPARKAMGISPAEALRDE
ncbi:FtsX-like permease family protein [Palleniella muris]|uniref:FtsX-like permease family protein n=1 Tax=Palleniella muris TaxID=3038145 RepID=A0AC61QP54_9BACT|nr:FtsX-like permease family protein [Palleniella muris]TGX81380.1 FtsX-like permease family protein [Palleniella muris]